ncbi:hypothetical protein RJ639_001495 [Escallonia herrerae]|uniref:Uncharacterized protein n=1 Tax=Escallonia herrerae TaxID=1293975 RepID=A0AA89BGP9_9ASTE|nr:hypothetical protein RJ639_001495 [Escallonia herrerae]
MEEKGVTPEKNTFRLVAEAWRGIGLVNEANKIMSDVEDDDMVISNAQDNDTIVSNQSGSAIINTQSRMELKRSTLSSESSSLTIKSMVFTPPTCRFGVKPMCVFHMQSRVQLPLPDAMLLDCTLAKQMLSFIGPAYSVTLQGATTMNYFIPP